MSSILSVSDLARRLNLGRTIRGYRGACPACGYPNAFSLKPGKADRIGLFCASCGDQDALLDAVTRVVGNAWTPPNGTRPADDPAAVQRNRDKAAALWTGSVSAVGTIADTYLTARGLRELAKSGALRFRADCPYPAGKGSRLPAMVAEVTGGDGAFRALHRTFLRRDGSAKADIETPRASLAPLWGGAVRLDPIAEEIVVGEGIETSASAGRLLALPAWAAISAGNMAAGLILPAEVRRVVIAADGDAAGEQAARKAALRWQREGRTVQIARPEKAGCDFNDILLGGEDG